MSDPDHTTPDPDLADRIDTLEQTLDTALGRIDTLERELAEERAARERADDAAAQALNVATDALQLATQHEDALDDHDLDAIERDAQLARSQAGSLGGALSNVRQAVADLQASELRKGQPVPARGVDETLGDPDVRIDDILDEEPRETRLNGVGHVALPGADPDLDLDVDGNMAEAVAMPSDALDIQSMAAFDTDTREREIGTQATRDAVRAWEERDKPSDASLWKKGGGPNVREYLDASALAHTLRIEQNIGRKRAEERARDALKKLPELTGGRVGVDTTQKPATPSEPPRRVTRATIREGVPVPGETLGGAPEGKDASGADPAGAETA